MSRLIRKATVVDMPLGADTKVAFEPSAARWRRVGDTVVVMDLKNSVYFSIDGSIAEVWSDLMDGSTLGEIATKMANQYDAPENVILNDLVGLVNQLIDRSVLSESSDA